MTDVTLGKPKQKRQDAVTSRFHMTLARRKIMWAYIFLAIPIVFFLYIRIYPALFAFQMSLYDWNPLAADQRYVGLENYQTLFTDLGTPQSVTQAAFINTTKYVALGMPIQLVLALGIALMLNEITFMSNVYRVMFFLPFVTSTIAISWVFRWLYQPRIGLINVILQTFSLPQQQFLRSTDQALYSIMAVVIWQGMGFAVIIFLAGLKQIPRVYYEAAEVDGASRWQSFRNITFPLLNPVIVYLVVLQSISFLRMFAEVLAMSDQGAGGPLNSTTTVVLRVYREAFQSLNMGYASTLTVVLFVIILVITVIQLRVLRRRFEI
jgi:multiple sugar transport system permease protein